MASVIVTGCATVDTTPSMNTTDLNGVDFSQDFDTGESCQRTVLFFGPFGSSSVVDAAKDGSIDQIEVVDNSWGTYLFGQYSCTTVYGSAN